jgi:hypothetical protein
LVDLCYFTLYHRRADFATEHHSISKISARTAVTKAVFFGDSTRITFDAVRGKLFLNVTEADQPQRLNPINSMPSDWDSAT